MRAKREFEIRERTGQNIVSGLPKLDFSENSIKGEIRNSAITLVSTFEMTGAKKSPEGIIITSFIYNLAKLWAL
ncbi:MAG: hypothetical protein BroJett011_07790 [Chloroflexota bacterium]|nr:MAG: hypothetical protein BroJett011_07790 [Chloroflexota bacterium]